MRHYATEKMLEMFQIELFHAFRCVEMLDCVLPVMKKYVDYPILQHLTRKLTKEETKTSMKNCNAFVIGFDESEINKVSLLELLVKVLHPEHKI